MGTGTDSSLKGKLLIAAPGLVDPNFVRTVVLVAEHNAEGALGLVLNRPTDLQLTALWSTIAPTPAPVETDLSAFVGGPVQKNAVLVLHGYEDLAAESEPIVPGVWLGSDVELFGKLMERLDGKTEADAEPVRVYCGYAGWGARQLDREMEQGGWLTANATAAQVFREPPQSLWRSTLSSLGGLYRILALMPPHPELN